MIATNVVELQNRIIEQPTYILTILSKLGYENVKDRGKYYQFKNHNGDNASGCAIYKDRLKYINFSHGEDGNIFTLVQTERSCDFPRALELIACWIGYTSTSYHKIRYPFGGFYKDIIKQQMEPELALPKYEETRLPSPLSLSKRFLDDGISLQVQEEWGVRYSHYDDAILIPIYFNNKLIGCKARANNDNDYSKRWWAYLEYPKSLCLYGFDKNYNSIIKKKTVIIAESEKSVLQAASFGLYIVLAVAGCNISKTQAKYIKSLMADNIIIAFDEDRNEEQILFECQKLITGNNIYKSNIGYIYDANKKYLGEKMSPFDQGKEIFNKLRKECIRWIN